MGLRQQPVCIYEYGIKKGGIDRMGAPSKGEDTKRHVITMRVTTAGRDRLQKAAEASGRSLSQEIESRLELSFQADQLLGGPDTAKFLRAVGSLIASIEQEIPGEEGSPGEESWYYRRMAWSALDAALGRIMEYIQPPIDLDLWDSNRDVVDELVRSAFAFDAANKKLGGLLQAFPALPHRTGSEPAAIVSEFERFEVEAGAARAELDKAIHAFEAEVAPQHRARMVRAREVGRKLAEEYGRILGMNFEIVPGVRLFVRTGQMHPLIRDE